MKLKFIIRESSNNILSEEGKGAQWIVYHSFGQGQTVPTDIKHLATSREHAVELVKTRIRDILDNGFKPGLGQRLGKGLYTVASFEDSVYSGSRYGQFTLKFNVNLSGFFILDKEIAKTVYGKYYSLKDQMRLLNIHKNKDKIIREFNPAFEAQSDFINKNFSMLREFLSESVYNSLDGVVLKTREDGMVVVGFKPDKFKLVGWSTDERGWKTELGSFTRDVYRKYPEEQHGEKINLVASVAKENNLPDYETKSFISVLLMFGGEDKVLQTQDLENEYPKVYKNVFSGMNVNYKEFEKLYPKFLTPEEIKIAWSAPTDYDDHYFNVVQPVLDKIAPLENEYKKDIFDRIVSVLNSGGFRSLTLSNKKEVATKFHKDLDGIPLSKWWK